MEKETLTLLIGENERRFREGLIFEDERLANKNEIIDCYLHERPFTKFGQLEPTKGEEPEQIIGLTPRRTKTLPLEKPSETPEEKLVPKFSESALEGLIATFLFFDI